RLDVPIFPQSPVENPLVSGGTGVRPDGTTFDIPGAFGGGYTTTNTGSGNLLFSPRVGVNYRTTGLGGATLQFRGGTGLFTGRTPFVWISNQYSNTGADFARLDQSFSTNAPAPVGFFPGTAEPADQPVPGVTPGLSPVATSALALTSPDFQFPQVWRSNLGFDQELPGGFTATVEGIFTEGLTDVGFVNLNIVQVGTAADGRPLYSNEIAGGSAAVQRVDGNFIDSILLDNTSEGYEYSVVAQLQRRVQTGFGGSLSYTYGRAFAVNNATSSVAYSNWRFNESQDPNDLDEVGTADFEVRHRVLGFGTFRTEYADRFSTQLGLVVDVRAGEPFSYIYSTDANGDGETSNDLVFVPETANDVFLTSNNYALFDAFIRGESGLDGYRGEIVPRNSGRAPAQARVDLELTQGVETVRGQRVDFELTLVNLLNLINSDWGPIRFANNQAVSAINFDRYITEGDIGSRVAGRVVTQDDIGKPVVSFSEQTARNTLTGDRYSTSDLASRWQLRFGVRYSF
ncbi:MAG TPA: hypothetical protein VF576_01250, partial [Rubricoccaceae bacterium]